MTPKPNKRITASINLILGIILFLLALSFFLYQFSFIKFNHPDDIQLPIRGIDISHHQGKIDWTAVSQSKINFVYIKSTEGGDFSDPSFLENIKEAKKNHLPAGAYHFFSLCRKGSEQADFFIKTISSVDMSLPPAVDLEFTGNCSKRPDRTEFLKQLHDFIERVNLHYKKSPIVYTTHDFFDAYLQDAQINPDQLWIRDIFLKPEGGWIFWQYANNGRISGISGRVDLNVFNGDSLQFEKLTHE